MSRYYWLKMPRDFFSENHRIKILLTKENGDRIVFFYIRLLLESISHEGYLRYSDTQRYTNEMLAGLFGVTQAFVDDAMKQLKEYELITIEDDGTIYLPQTAKMIGSETDSARRMRVYRAEKPKGKIKKSNEKPKVKKDNSNLKSEHQEIIDYLNEKTGKSFKASTPNTQKAINGRLSEGYTVEDFKKVIDTKTSQWLNNPDMQKYLCPDTLFRPSNFEKYLNESASKKSDYEDAFKGMDGKMDERLTGNLDSGDFA